MLGYSGVGIYTRQSVCAPIRAEEGILGVLCPPSSSVPYRELPSSSAIGGYPDLSEVTSRGVDPAALDAEGRCIILEFPAFVLFGVYSPANSNGMRNDFRHAFLISLDTRIRNLAKLGKNVILTGDLNVSRDLIDTAKAEDAMRSEGLTHDEYLGAPNRRIFNQLLFNGKIPGERDEGREEPVLYDLCREFHPNRQGMFTHWEQKINARPGNFGSRIDFILCSISIKDWFKEANIQEGLMGSDHCPVFAVTREQVPVPPCPKETQVESDQENTTHLVDLMNPPGMFKNGVRLREYDSIKDVPILSGKLLPEFTKRRNIRDMFSKKPALPKPASPTSFVPADAQSQSQPQSQGETDASQPSFTSTADTASQPEVSAVNPITGMNGSTAPNLSILKSPEKRRAPSSASPGKSVKRTKSSLSSSGTSTVKGQQSLKGFFQSRTKPADLSLVQDAASSLAAVTTPTQLTQPSSTAYTPLVSDRPPTPPILYDPDPRATQEASRESWTKLFSRKPAPRCEHGEPCITLTTKKPGINNGRQFWMCPRPIGPSGQKEVGTQWRCGTFIWASDWKGG